MTTATVINVPAALSKVAPTIPSLVEYAKAIHKNSPVFVKRIDKFHGKNIVTLSTGFSYFIGADNKWNVYHDTAGNLFPVFYN